MTFRVIVPHAWHRSTAKGAVMLFLYRGRYAPAVRAATGIVLLVIGLAIGRGTVLVLIGGVLVAWGAISGLSALRTRGQSRNTGGGTIR
jgi:hypothetical protein